jgi:hypothetical protein
LLLASIGSGLALGPYIPNAVAFTVLVVVGVAAADATAGLGATIVQTSRPRVALMPGGTASITGPAVVDSRAAVTLLLGIAGIVLVWPLGILLAPPAFWAGITAVRRISQDPARLGGLGRAKTGALIGSFIYGMYLFWILVDVAAIFLFGSPIPAAP